MTAAWAAPSENEAQARLDAIGQDIQSASQSLATTGDARDEASAALREVETELADTHQRLDELQGERRELAQQVAELEDRRAAMQAERSAQREALGRQLDALYRLGSTPQLKLLLNQNDPAHLDRMQAYLNVLAEARNARLDALAELDRRLVDNRRELDSRGERLTTLADELEERSQTLAQQSHQRQTLVADLDQRYDSEASRLETLNQDRAHAERVLREVQEAMARLSEPPPSTAIERTRGDLPWPVQGMMVSRYQQSRGVHKNGILIQAPAGTAVAAVHAGRVVFADWMRGFGNLLIIDHGDQVMTLYAHLQQFDVSVGSRIASGQPLGRVGVSGGRDTPGLYFEVRRRGDPINPQSWIARR
ncbi:murein hydrolase activator EnvC family protein [Halomonas sp. V046]|uniref:murein hydrolase activator EnvC family protein n=1 Tax=Halomonas sp. V046 TaxID=3459611 RepID=UPI004044B431